MHWLYIEGARTEVQDAEGHTASVNSRHIQGIAAIRCAANSCAPGSNTPCGTHPAVCSVGRCTGGRRDRAVSVIPPEMAYVEETMSVWMLPLDAEEVLGLMHADRDEALAYLARVASLLRMRGCRTRVAVREGVPWRAITSLAESMDVDLIAFTARRKSLLARIWGLDTVNRVLAHVCRPVLLVAQCTPVTFDRLIVYTPERRAPIDRLLHCGVAERALAQCSGPVLITPRVTALNS